MTGTVDGVSRPMVRSAVSLMTSTVLTAVLGFAFWALAARSVDAETLGRDSALIAALVSLSAIAQLNGAAAATRFLPRLGKRTAPLLARGYLAICVASLLTGAVFVLVAPAVSHELEVAGAAVGVGGLFAVGVVLWSIFAVQDAALAAVRRSPWVPVENGVYAVLKILALAVLAAAGVAAPVFAAWVLPLLLVVPAITWLLFKRAIPEHVAGQGPGPQTTDGFGRRRLSTFLAQDYAACALYQLSLTALPLLVVALLGARENAWFAVAFGIVSGLTLLSHNAVTALIVEGAFRREHLSTLIPSVLRRLLVPLAAGSLTLALIAPLVLIPFGDAYVENSAAVLRLLAVANVFRTAVVLYEALCRLEGEGGRILAVNAGQLALLVALTAALAPVMGADGVGLAWLVTNAAVALCCARPLWRTLRGLPQVVPATA